MTKEERRQELLEILEEYIFIDSDDIKDYTLEELEELFEELQVEVEGSDGDSFSLFSFD